MSTAPKILAFAGSARRDSFNKKLLKIAVTGARAAGGEVTEIDLNDYPLPVFNEDLEKKEGLPENAKKIKKLMLSHQGFLIASPEYNSSITGLLKNTIDWASRPAEGESTLECFTDKVAAIMSASPGALGGLRGLYHVREILANINVLVLHKLVTVSQAHEAFAEDGNLKDSKKQEAVQKHGAQLVKVLRKLAD